MGTPDFAVPTLFALCQSRHKVVRVVTQPDRPKGRGRRLARPPVKTAALDLGVQVVQPPNLKNAGFMEELTDLRPDVLVVVAFGRILSRPVLELPCFGAVNLHASLLPKYRGPAPIQWAIVNGEAESGVTSMKMDAGLDTGDMLIKRATPITAQDTAQSLHDRLAEMGAEVMVQTLDKLAGHDIRPVPQDHGAATYAPMLKKSDGKIDWTLPAQKLDCFIRGMTPWPGAFTFCGNTRLRILSAEPVAGSPKAPPGTVLRPGPHLLEVVTGDGRLRIDQLQGASGKRLCSSDYLAGNPVEQGTCLI